MKTDLDHLPGKQQRDLARIVEILFEEFEKACADKTTPHNRKARILKIVLFGSYARGDWVRDRVSGYVSDYDILVVVNHDEFTDTADYWVDAEQRLMRDYAIHKRLAAPLGLIVHSLEDVNNQLALGRYFFVDIVKDGIALYERFRKGFARPQKPPPDVAYKEAKDYFEHWYGGVNRFFELAADAKSKSFNTEAAFLLHQTSERLYHCTSLTFTLYSPASHNLHFLRPRAETLDMRLVAAWPRATRRQRRTFELIRRAYVEARYSKHYKITPAELALATAQVAALRDLVRAGCEEKLAQMQAAIASGDVAKPSAP